MMTTAPDTMQDDFDREIADATHTDVRVDLSENDVRSSLDCIKILHPDGRIAYMNRNGLCAMEIAHHADVAGQIWWDLWPEDMRDRVRASVDAARNEVDCVFEGVCPTAGGTLKAWQVTVKPVLAGDGRIASILARSRELDLSVAA